MRIRLLGPLTVWRDGCERSLPASRKARALLAFLAVSATPVPRSRLCELLWDVPDDPRGELRWCLSKLRSVLDDPSHRRVTTPGDAIALDLGDCVVDTAEFMRLTGAGLQSLDLQGLRAADALFGGEFAEGLELDRNPQFASWLGAQRRRLRAARVGVLERIVAQLPAGGAESFEYLEKWLQVAPFDTRAHEAMLEALVRSGRMQEGENHLAATIRLFEAEGLEWLTLREKWRTARSAAATAPAIVPVIATSSASAARMPESTGASRRASVCVMPFVDRSAEGTQRGGLADGLTDDIITRLAKLRLLFVIARGSVYALRERNIPPDEAGRLLKVDYVASGSLRRHGDSIVVSVELAETRTASIVWTEEFECRTAETLAAFDAIGNRIVAAIAEEIELAERNRAMLKAPASLDSWEAYHRGLWHMYRFTAQDNRHAAHFFQTAVQRDPTFARAYAGLSFTHFQNVFLHLTEDRDKEIELAFDTAGRSITADERDPAAHWAMGRALWLRGRQEESQVELEKSIHLSPNFALGHYTLGFVQCQSGDPRSAIAATDYSRHLSPFDPLLFAMLTSRAIAHVRLGEYEEAAEWAMRGAARVNAHAHILAIAAACLDIAGRREEAAPFVTAIRRNAPSYRVEDLLDAFRFSADTAALFGQHAVRAGLS